MSDWASIASVLAIIWVFVWLRSEIETRLPDRTTHALPRLGMKSFDAYGGVETFWVQQFGVEFVESWYVGHELHVIAMGKLCLTDHSSEEDSEQDSRIYLQFYPSEDPYPRTDQIGWATVTDNEQHRKYTSIRLLLRGPTIASFVNELRLSQEQSISVRGFENDKGRIVITSVHLSPA